MTGDVFEEHPGWLDLADDAGDIWPQVPLVVGPAALPGHAEGLAGVSCQDGVDRAAQGAPVEGGDIIPDRGGGEVSGPLGCDDGAAWVFFPFDKASGVETGLGQHEAHIKATGSCAEAKAVSGT